jgi:hypothetical protein
LFDVVSKKMADDWTPHETSTHQDHVVAHVIGATILGYFMLEQAIAILLDIGFIWTIYVDGEMGLLLQSVMISELEVDAETRARLSEDAQLLHDDGPGAEGLVHFTAAPTEFLIADVRFEARGEDERRILVASEEEEAVLAIETSLSTGEVRVHVAAGDGAGQSIALY